MSSSVNKVILIGNVGDAPKITVTQDGKKFASFSLATGESWKDKQTGEKKTKTEWHRISILNSGLVEHVVEKYVDKGSKIYVEGQLQTDKYVDKNGVEKYSTKIVLTGFNGELKLLGNGGQQQDTQPKNQGKNVVRHADYDPAFTEQGAPF